MRAIEKLVQFAIDKGLLPAQDEMFARNALLAAMKLESPDDQSGALSLPDDGRATATEMLNALSCDAARREVIRDTAENRDRFSAHLMNILTPPPSQVRARFAQLCQSDGIEAATDWFYALCRASDYIRVDQIAKNMRMTHESRYGQLEITVNLSKPEKDPRDIEAQANASDVTYPPCMLCLENEGYAGRPGYPSHETLRTTPVTLGGDAWSFQYSPYSYYEEHCIVLSDSHVPMTISRRTFTRLLEFADLYPHYFIGSNADLPIVGGSILSHEHFQGGRRLFPMDRAPVYARFEHPDYADVTIEAVSWPMTCIRLSSRDGEALTGLAEHLLTVWRQYDDADHDILHKTEKTHHNTVTPIARKQEDGGYVMQIVLRNNRTNAAHPMGIFHPHAELHHIKKENIGLIEVMGLFILPGRLKTELEGLEKMLTGESPLIRPAVNDPLEKHFDWIQSLVSQHGARLSSEKAQAVLRHGIGEKCERVLEDCGVFKMTDTGKAGLKRFLLHCGCALPLAHVYSRREFEDIAP